MWVLDEAASLRVTRVTPAPPGSSSVHCAVFPKERLMKVFLAGATGALGRRLIPLLRGHGHDVTGLTRSPEKREALRLAGATPVVADALDEPAMIAAVALAEPDVVVHQLTDLTHFASIRRFEQ